MFDNEGSPFAAGTQSRAIVLEIDEHAQDGAAANASTAIRRRCRPRARAACSCCPNGNVFVGWGAEPFVSEFSSDRASCCSTPDSASGYVELPRVPVPLERQSARAGRRSRQRAAARRATDLWVSWNGDTQVQRWLVLSGGAGGALSPAGIYRPSGFETAIALEGSPQRLAVRGLDSRGRTLGQSATLTV